MNDRFKFRAWHKKSDGTFEMIYDAQATYDNACNGQGSADHCDFQEVLDDPDCIVEQCIGEKDKNGKLVFDGDVIQENGINRYIHWHDGGWCYSVRYDSKCHWHLRKEDVENAEIIGNIHDGQFREVTKKVEG